MSKQKQIKHNNQSIIIIIQMFLIFIIKNTHAHTNTQHQTIQSQNKQHNINSKVLIHIKHTQNIENQKNTNTTHLTHQ